MIFYKFSHTYFWSLCKFFFHLTYLFTCTVQSKFKLFVAKYKKVEIAGNHASTLWLHVTNMMATFRQHAHPRVLLAPSMIRSRVTTSVRKETKANNIHRHYNTTGQTADGR